LIHIRANNTMMKRGVYIIMLLSVGVLAFSSDLFAAAPAPAANPGPSSGAPVSNTEFMLSWDPSAGATGYYVFLSDTNPPDYAGSTAGTTWPTSVLTDETTYYWKVIAYAGSDNASATVWNFHIDVPEKLAWAKKSGGANVDVSQGVAVLPDGSAVVTGYFQGTATFGPGEPTQVDFTSYGLYDIFVARYNRYGDLVWAKQAGDLGEDLGTAVAALPDGSVVVTGSFQGTADFGGANLITDSATSDIFLAKYNADGSTAWAVSAGGLCPENCSHCNGDGEDPCTFCGGRRGRILPHVLRVGR